MSISPAITRERMHHAYLLESPTEEGVAYLRALLEGLGISARGNPDFHEYAFDVLLLEHAHHLRREQTFHSALGAPKVFVVAFKTIMREAQNALLKTIEEPTDGTHFFFVTQTRSHLLPTFLSRVQVLNQSSDIGHQSVEGEGEKFLAASIPERLTMIEPITKAKDEDRPEAKEDARRLLESLERALTLRALDAAGADGNPRAVALGEIISAKRHLAGRSPSPKLLLEHLALVVPQTLEMKG